MEDDVHHIALRPVMRQENLSPLHIMQDATQSHTIFLLNDFPSELLGLLGSLTQFVASARLLHWFIFHHPHAGLEAKLSGSRAGVLRLDRSIYPKRACIGATLLTSVPTPESRDMVAVNSTWPYTFSISITDVLLQSSHVFRHVNSSHRRKESIRSSASTG